MARTARGSVVLLSGGMDSATCLALAARSAGPVDALTVSYGQRHGRELASARTLARWFGVRRHETVQIPVGHLLDSSLTDARRPIPHRAGPPRSGGAIPSTYVPARNTLFLALALGYAESVRAASIYLGANALDYSGYPDCRPEYFRAFRALARVATRAGLEGRSPVLRTPLLKLTKAEIVALGERLGVPWEKTWSCYLGGRRPCGRCDACRFRAKGFRIAGVEDPLLSRAVPRSRTG